MPLGGTGTFFSGSWRRDYWDRYSGSWRRHLDNENEIHMYKRADLRDSQQLWENDTNKEEEGDPKKIPPDGSSNPQYAHDSCRDTKKLAILHKRRYVDFNQDMAVHVQL